MVPECQNIGHIASLTKNAAGLLLLCMYCEFDAFTATNTTGSRFRGIARIKVMVV